MSKNAAVLNLISGLSEMPFWAVREITSEKTQLLKASGLAIAASKFRPPPLQTAFGPGAAYPCPRVEAAKKCGR